MEVDGVRLPLDPALVYYLLAKPRGVVSTASDTHERATVVGLVPVEPRVYPVGRLDADSEGLILLTNDGALTQLVTHPSFGVEKTYSALVEGAVNASTARRLERGVSLDDGVAKAKRAKVVDRHGGRSIVELVMTEGRKREVRRMLAATGHPVVRLVRTAIGPVTDRDLEAGEWRTLTVAEVRALYSAGGGSWEHGADPAADEDQ